MKEAPSADDAELFRRAVEALDDVPDKDTEAHFEAPKPPRVPRRRRPPRRTRDNPDAVLDLHGMKAAEARARLRHFIAWARRHGEKTVLVITGKGLRSPGGVSVIKEDLERWVQNEGATHLDAWSEAPRHLGGRGAYLLYLRR